MSKSKEGFVWHIPGILLREISVHYGTGEGIDQEAHISLRKLDPKKVGFSGVIGLGTPQLPTFKLWSEWYDSYNDIGNPMCPNPILFLRCVAEPVTRPENHWDVNIEDRYDEQLRMVYGEAEELNMSSPEAKFLNWLLPIISQLARREISVKDVGWDGFEVAVKRRKIDWILLIIRMLFEECFTSRTGKQINYISTQIEGQVTYEIIRLAIAEFKGQRKDIMTYIENAPRKMLEYSREDFTLSQKAEAILKKMDKVYIQLSQERERGK